MKYLILIIGFLFSFIDTKAQDATVMVLNPEAPWYSQNARIDSATFFVTPVGLNTQVAMYATLSPNNWPYPFNSNTNLEFVYRFSLPADALVTDMWLWVNGKIMKAYLLDQFTASQIYEGIVSRNRRDPALLKKISDTTYEIRIFPVTPTGTRKIKIEFQLPQQMNAQTAVTAFNLRSILPPNAKTKTTLALYKPAVWGNPQLNVASYLPVVEVDSLTGKFHQYTIANDSNTLPLVITYQNPGSSSNKYVSYSSSGSNGTYELAVTASHLFNLQSSIKRNVLFVLDEDPLKTTISRTALKASITAFAINELSPTDSFNVIASGLQPFKASEKWISASDTARIRQTFDAAFSKLANFSSLSNALAIGVKFANENGRNARIVLIAATDSYGNLNAANSLIEALRSASQATYPYFILDYAIGNQVQFTNIGGTNYRGNGYLYSYLASATKGDFLYSAQTDPLVALRQVTIKLSGLVSAFEVTVSTQDGFTDGKFINETNMLGFKSIYYQSGKFQGSWPLIVSAVGVYDGKLVSHQFQIERSAAIDLGKYVTRSWSGRMIRKLVADGSPNAATEALRLSLSERILSKYTAFLALEPSDTVKVCTDCVDETVFLPLDESKLETPSDSIKVYPNPFNAATSIQIALPATWLSRDVKIEIYSITGQKVYTFPSSSFTGQQFTLRWNAAGFATGIYMLRVQHPLGIRTAKLVLIK